MKKIFVIIAAVLMIFVYSAAFAGNEHTPGLDNETGPADIVVDVLLTRPIGLVGLVAGTAVFFVTLPIAAISNSIDRTSETLVKEPFAYTFKRPLGDIRGEKNY